VIDFSQSLNDDDTVRHDPNQGRWKRWSRRRRSAPAAAAETGGPGPAAPRSSSLLVSPDGRDFRRLWAGDSISQLGTQVGFIALPLLAVTVLNADEFQMGLLATFETLAFLLIGLPAGAWVDRMRKRSVLITGDLLRAIALLALPITYAFGVLSFPLLLVVVAMVGLATVFFDVAYQSYLPDLVPAERISEGNAKLQISQSAAMVVGPAVGGLLIRAFGAPLVLLVDAVSFLGSALSCLRIKHREQPAPKAGRRPLWVEIGEGLSFVVRQPLLRRIVGTTALSNLFNSVTQAMFVLYAIRDLGLGEAGLGIALSVGAVGGLIGAVVAEPFIRLVGEGRSIVLAILPALPAVALVPLAAGQDFTTAMVMLSVSMAVYGFGVVIYNVAQVSFRQRLCPRPLLGRMNASVRFVVFGCQPVGAFFGGIIGARFGVQTALWIAVAGQAIAVLPVLLSPLVRMRELPRTLVQHAGE
jgi:MFS family permease